MNEYSLLSSEKVYLKLKLAGIGSRFAACFIDGLFQGIIWISIVLLAAFGFSILKDMGFILSQPGVWKGWLMAIPLLIMFTIFHGYNIFFETVWNGQTPGKRFLKLRVVQDNGSSITFLQVLIRNIVRMIDALPAGYAIGIISALISKKNQRLGDMAAGTVVIREAGEDVPAAINFEVTDTPWSGVARLHMHEISEADFAILKKYLLRRESLKQAEAQASDQKLALFFSQKLGLKPEETGTSAEFLKQVAAMYQQR